MKVAVQVEAEMPMSQWSGIVERCGGSPMHFPAVCAAEHSGCTSQFILFLQRGRVVACALAVLVVERRWQVGPGRRILTLDTAPALLDGPDVSEETVVDSLVTYARKQRYSEIRIGSRWSWDRSKFTLHEPQVIGRSIEFRIQLDTGWEEVLLRMEKNHRRNLRRHCSRNVEVVHDSSLEGLLALRDLQGLSSERAAERGTAFAVRSKRHFENIYESLYKSGPGRLLLARQRGETIGALAYLVGARKALTVRSGANRRGYKELAMYALHDRLLQELLEDGVREVNLGAVPEGAQHRYHLQHGLYMFKRGFGAREDLTQSVRYDVARAKGAVLDG